MYEERTRNVEGWHKEGTTQVRRRYGEIVKIVGNSCVNRTLASSQTYYICDHG